MKTFKQFLSESKKEVYEAIDDKFDRYSKDIAPYLPNKKYKKGEFGYWWTIIEGNEDIEGKVYKGNINCVYKKLTSLKGCPKEVKGDFDCAVNQLTSLKGGPKEVKGNFGCSGNNLTSLEGGPQKVGGGFYCQRNNLTSLKGAPKEVGGEFWCFNNKLTSLEGAPEKVKGEINSDIKKKTNNNEDYDESIDFELYNPDFGEWEDTYVMIQYDERKKGIVWDDESSVSPKGFDDPKKALDDYKKFLSKRGFKYKGLKL